jgi:predicted nucleic acid-binding protein
LLRYYTDTYALIEILRNNPAYEKYAGEELITSEFNLLELAYALVRDYEVNRALEILRIVRASVEIVAPKNEDYVEAATLCIKLRKERRNLSIYHRCLGIRFS